MLKQEREDTDVIKVLFVCMGNICRSPTAESVFRRLVQAAGLESKILIDSAGTHDYHVGQCPDKRAQRAAQQRGYFMEDLRGRQVSAQDFQKFDYVLAMDMENLGYLQRICPKPHAHKVDLLMSFSKRFQEREVPDPYYGGAEGFETVLDMVEDACRGLLEKITSKPQRLSAR